MKRYCNRYKILITRCTVLYGIEHTWYSTVHFCIGTYNMWNATESYHIWTYWYCNYALKSCRHSWPIGSRESELHAFEILLDNCNGISELGEEEAYNNLLKKRKITEVALDVAIELYALARLEVYMEGGMRFGALLELFEDPHLNG